MIKEKITGKEKAFIDHTFLTTREVCDLLRVSGKTLWVWKEEGRFVMPYRSAQRRLLYPTAEVLDWLEKRRCGATAEATKAEATKAEVTKAEMVAWLERKCAKAETSKVA